MSAFRKISPTIKQLTYVNYMKDPKTSLVFAHGPAGTGKTLFACKTGLKQLMDNQIKKLVLTRPTVSVGNDLGYLPGGIDDKMHPWMIPVFDSFLQDVSQNTLNNMLSNNYIEICPISYVRGRTFDNAFVIADEMQNSTSIEMKTLLTRIGNNTKLVVTGDLAQSDLPVESNGLDCILSRLDTHCYNDDMIKEVKFEIEDCERSELVKEILRLYDVET